MARITKAALEQQVLEAQAQIAQLTAALEQANAALALAAQQVADLEAIAGMKRDVMQRPRVRTAYEMPAWQVSRMQQMAEARTLAMRIGRSVKVA